MNGSSKANNYHLLKQQKTETWFTNTRIYYCNQLFTNESYFDLCHELCSSPFQQRVIANNFRPKITSHNPYLRIHFYQEKPKVMEIKKHPSCDLNCYRNLFVELGLVLALGVILLAFEFKTSVKKAEIAGSIVALEIESEVIPITRQDEVKPPPPPPPPRVIEVLNIVSNDIEIEDELEIEDTEADAETEIDVSSIVVDYSQEEKEQDEEQVFYVVEEMPEFPGGELALRKFLANAIKYPVIAQENGVEGKVYVSFIVGKDGRVSNARIIRSVDQSLDKEALRVVNSLPVWKPGLQRGQPVRVAFSVPIHFVLQ